MTAAIADGFGNEQTELTTASSFGIFSFAWAGGPDTLAETHGNANLAIMQGENGRALAGSGGTQFENLNIAINFGNGIDTPPRRGKNPSLDTQTNTVATIGQGNIAANFFGDSIPGRVRVSSLGWSVVRAGGLTLGLPPTGFANAAYNFFGDGNQVTVGDQASNFGLGFSVFGDRNDVNVNGPLAAGGALFQSDRIVVQTGPGIEINGYANPTGSTTNVLAAGGTQRSSSGPASTSVPSLRAARSEASSGPASTRRLTSARPSPRVGRYSRRSVTGSRRRTKKFSDTVSSVTSRRHRRARRGAKAAASTSSGDE